MQSIRRRVGLAVSALPVLFLVFDAVIKLIEIDPVTESMTRLGYPEHLSRSLGAIELVCVLFYLAPRTAMFGAMLMTGFLGGAVATHLRAGHLLGRMPS